ncbi:MAG: hypothetical protein JW902_11005 [Syntrophaceae bacterium]|nr:hypothetical protein [Syntrophaceae bacterium]
MKKILFLIVLCAAIPLLGQSEETGVSVQTPGGSIEIKTGEPDNPPEKTDVVVERTTVVQPRGGCGCMLPSGGPCK